PARAARFHRTLRTTAEVYSRWRTGTLACPPPRRCTLLLLLLLVLLAPRFALGFEGVELRALVGGEDRQEPLLLGIVELLHLRALRLERRLQRLDLRGVARFLGRAHVLPRLMHGLEERLVVLPEAAVQGLPLILLRVGEVELLRQAHAHRPAVMAAVAPT